MFWKEQFSIMHTDVVYHGVRFPIIFFFAMATYFMKTRSQKTLPYSWPSVCAKRLAPNAKDC